MVYDYPRIAREVTGLVEQRITPILGTTKAQELVEGTTYIDKVAEDTVIGYLADNNIGCVLVTEES
ncbi:MAG: hypothetical protein HXS46_00360, partial [Theionarchaea archaeon]|nr:hypothetical protein [Theionarchaea archaeon]